MTRAPSLVNDVTILGSCCFCQFQRMTKTTSLVPQSPSKEAVVTPPRAFSSLRQAACFIRFFPPCQPHAHLHGVTRSLCMNYE